MRQRGRYVPMGETALPDKSCAHYFIILSMAGVAPAVGFKLILLISTYRIMFSYPSCHLVYPLDTQLCSAMIVTHAVQTGARDVQFLARLF